MTLQSERGRLLLPNLDDRTWQDLVDEMVKQLIPKYARQWTDHNLSDLGITLIELFAWLVEGLIYRLNRVPEKNYIAFLNLLGIPRDPPTPARVELTFYCKSVSQVIIPKGTQIQTQGTESETPIVFETDQNLVFEPSSELKSGSVSAHNALTIWNEELEKDCSGERFQVYQLRHYPLFKQPGAISPYDHLVIQVFPKDTSYPDGSSEPNPNDEDQKKYIWRQVEDFVAPEEKSYRFDPVTGEIRFGGAGHGKTPDKGSKIRALTYRYVAGGAAGNVAAGKVTMLSGKRIEGVVEVKNLVAAEGGSDEEPIEETLRRAPEAIKTRDRAVTAEDYEYLAREATTDVAIVRCLGPRLHEADKVDGATTIWKKDAPWTFAQIDRSAGNVTVIIVPRLDIPRPPLPLELKNEVQAYLDQRRDLTAKLDVTGPRYLPVKAVVTLYLWKRSEQAGYSTADLKADTEKKIVSFLHHVTGGPDRSGWQIGQGVSVADFFRAIMPDEKIGHISQLSITAEQPDYVKTRLENERPFPLDIKASSIRVADYELVCSAKEHELTVQVVEE